MLEMFNYINFDQIAIPTEPLFWFVVQWSGMLHSFIGFLFDVITCKLQWNKKEAKVGDTLILPCNVQM